MAMFLRTRRRVRPRVAAARRGGATLRVHVSCEVNVCEKHCHLLLSCFLAAPDGLLRALARAGVRLRALAVDRQPAAMPDAAVGADLGQALDRLLALTAKVALHLELAVDEGAELRHLVVSEVLDLRVRREAELGCDLARRRLADAVDVG